MKTVLALLALFVAPAASAFDLTFDVREHAAREVPPGVTLQRLVTMTSSRDSNINYLNLMLDTNVLISGIYNENDPKNTPGSGENEHVFWLRDIENDKGAVLARAKGRDAVILLGKLDRATQEGRFTVKYLANGLTMRYETCDFDLKRNANKGAWYVKNIHTGATVTAIHFETHSLGLKPIKAICKQ